MSTTLKFANDLLRRLGNSQTNTFYSGISIQIALGMLQMGAKNRTKMILEDVTHIVNDVDFRQLHLRTNASTSLALANAVWLANRLHFSSSYLAKIHDLFNAAVNNIDIDKPAEAANKINNWCLIHTKRKIDKLIEATAIDSNTRLVLTNAVYFKDRWKTQFPIHRTTKEKFLTPNGPIDVAMMNRYGSSLYGTFAGTNDGFECVDLPYESDDLSMLVILPTDHVKYMDIELTYKVARQVMQHENNVYIGIPRFSIQKEYDLREPLEYLGAEIIFSDQANFSGITEGSEPLKVSQVMHKACIDVNEEGTEASAATAVRVMRCLSLPEKNIIFNAERPFLFIIHKPSTNTILFCGRVCHPTPYPTSNDADDNDADE